jgi:hypothetical protein
MTVSNRFNMTYRQEKKTCMKPINNANVYIKHEKHFHNEYEIYNVTEFLAFLHRHMAWGVKKGRWIPSGPYGKGYPRGKKMAAGRIRVGHGGPV